MLDSILDWFDTHDTLTPLMADNHELKEDVQPTLENMVEIMNQHFTEDILFSSI